ncbi:Holliday junction branch migration protein RuvA [Candidatus Nomurabacteria bacterium]|nr:Holliday junction branch migration protein RuvA [Candidatus Nomurabacteria bacterium]
MIASIKGKIIKQNDKYIVLENNGIGYKVHISPDTLSKITKKEDIFFWTYQNIREDAMDLYGFLEISELEFFEMLISVSGIGPKSALGILGIASIDTLRKAIGTGDISYLTKISGIGKKTAERIVIDLRDKFKGEEKGGSMQGELDALEALKSLGYSQNEARDALKQVSPDTNTNMKIKEALKILGK